MGDITSCETRTSGPTYRILCQALTPGDPDHANPARRGGSDATCLLADAALPLILGRLSQGLEVWTKYLLGDRLLTALQI